MPRNAKKTGILHRTRQRVSQTKIFRKSDLGITEILCTMKKEPVMETYIYDSAAKNDACKKAKAQSLRTGRPAKGSVCRTSVRGGALTELYVYSSPARPQCSAYKSESFRRHPTSISRVGLNTH